MKSNKSGSRGKEKKKDDDLELTQGLDNSAFTLQRRESLAIACLPTVHHARGRFKQINVECSSLKSLL